MSLHILFSRTFTVMLSVALGIAVASLIYVLYLRDSVRPEVPRLVDIAKYELEGSGKVLAYDRINQLLYVHAQSRYDSDVFDDFVLKIEPSTVFRTRDMTIQDSVIVGVTPWEVGLAEDIREGMPIAFVYIARDKGLFAKYVLYGNPFPTP